MKSKQSHGNNMKRTSSFFLGALLFVSVAATLSAQITNVIFSDDFETGALTKWSTTATSPLTISTPTNVVPPSPTGQFSAMIVNSLNRMHRNLIADNGGSELTGAMILTFWMYDD